MSLAIATHEATEVGFFYMVPCLFVERSVSTPWMPNDGWVPVLGPRHEDGKHLNFPFEHYHVDWRFIPGKAFDWTTTSPSGFPHGRVLTKTTPEGLIGSPVLKRRKCRRAMPDHPPIKQVRGVWLERGPSSWQAMESDHACTRLKPGNICPHRGIDLTPFIKDDGTVICPGHGLKWDTKTGELLAHHGAPA